MIKTIIENDICLLEVDDIVESVSGLSAEDDILLNYMRHFDRYIKDNAYVLMLGGGGYAWPKHFLKHFNGLLDVVEINPQFTQIAKEKCFLKDNARLRIIHMDGREYIKQPVGPYDIIINDMFLGIEPVYLNMSDVYKILKSDGVYLQNIIGRPRIEYVSAANNSILIWDRK